jgi:hypothetical protein
MRDRKKPLKYSSVEVQHRNSLNSPNNFIQFMQIYQSEALRKAETRFNLTSRFHALIIQLKFVFSQLTKENKNRFSLCGR